VQVIPAVSVTSTGFAAGDLASAILIAPVCRVMLTPIAVNARPICIPPTMEPSVGSM
jgi:hypothetical protein